MCHQLLYFHFIKKIINNLILKVSSKIPYEKGYLDNWKATNKK